MKLRSILLSSTGVAMLLGAYVLDWSSLFPHMDFFLVVAGAMLLGKGVSEINEK